MRLRARVVGLILVVLGTGAMAHALADKGNAPPLTGAMHEFILQTPAAPAPDVTFSDGENAAIGFQNFKGKVTLVNLWATWCAPCVKEMPSLEALKSLRGGADFEIVTISEDRGARKAIDPFFDKNGLAGLPRYVDAESAVGRALHVRGLPTTLLFDRNGREIGRFEGGADWSTSDALALIDWALKTDAAPDTPKP